MTSYNGQAITYDEIGNPLSYDGWTFVWESGRQLKRMTKDGSTIDYKYDDNGIRTSKTVNGITTNYTTIDGRITSQDDGTNFLYFRYESNDQLVGVQINGTEYIYLKNLQGDVVSILDMNGQSVVDYTYDAWGKVTSISGSMADTIGNLNPMRYRSYYYDNESGYYYLQSRYYDSNTCRFINADESSMLELTKGEAVGANLFAYCGNDPANNVDPSGHIKVSSILSLFSGLILQYLPLFLVPGAQFILVAKLVVILAAATVGVGCALWSYKWSRKNKTAKIKLVISLASVAISSVCAIFGYISAKKSIESALAVFIGYGLGWQLGNFCNVDTVASMMLSKKRR